MRSLVDQFGYIDIYAPTVLWWTNPPMSLTADMGAELVDPLKTTIVQGQRCMTTWVTRRKGSSG
jgi:hypothetical protein